jgi:hypothetical protein
VSKSSWCRFTKPLAVLVGIALVTGCSGEENIPVKKVDGFVLEPPPKDFKEKRPGALARPGSSAKGGRGGHFQ